MSNKKDTVNLSTNPLLDKKPVLLGSNITQSTSIAREDLLPLSSPFVIPSSPASVPRTPVHPIIPVTPFSLISPILTEEQIPFLIEPPTVDPPTETNRRGPVTPVSSSFSSITYTPPFAASSIQSLSPELSFPSPMTISSHPRQSLTTPLENKEIRGENGMFHCSFPGCGKQFPERFRLNRHKELHDPSSKKHACIWLGCGERFRGDHQLKRHMQSHTGKKPYSCDQCPEAYVTTLYLKKHKAKVHGENSNLTVLTQSSVPGTPANLIPVTPFSLISPILTEGQKAQDSKELRHLPDIQNTEAMQLEGTVIEEGFQFSSPFFSLRGPSTEYPLTVPPVTAGRELVTPASSFSSSIPYTPSLAASPIQPLYPNKQILSPPSRPLESKQEKKRKSLDSIPTLQISKKKLRPETTHFKGFGDISTANWHTGISLSQELLNELGYDQNELNLLNKHTSDPTVFGILKEYQKELSFYKISPLLIRGILFSETCRQNIQKKIEQLDVFWNNSDLVEFLNRFCLQAQLFCQSISFSPDSFFSDSYFSAEENRSLDQCLDDIFNIDLIPSLSLMTENKSSSLSSTDDKCFSASTIVYSAVPALQSSLEQENKTLNPNNSNLLPGLASFQFLVGDEKIERISPIENSTQEKQARNPKKSIKITEKAITQSVAQLKSIFSSSSSSLAEVKDQISSSIQRQLQKYGIQHSTFNQLRTSLKQRGFSEKLAERMLINPIYFSNLNYVLERYIDLRKLSSEIIKPCHLEKLIRYPVCANYINALINYFPELHQEFTADAIMRMISHRGGYRNLEAVKNNFKALKDLQFTTNQIVQIVSHAGGSHNLEAVKNNFKALKDLQFTTNQIIQIASHDGGSRNLEAVIKDCNLLKGLQFTAKQIVQMVSHMGGSLNLEAVIKDCNVLKGLQFTAKQIVQMVSHGGGSRNLEAVKNNYQALTELHFTAEQIVRMLSHIGGSRNLEAVKNNYQALTELHFTADQIVRMVSHDSGSRNLEAVKNAWQALKELHFTADQIVRMVSHISGSRNLEAVENNYQALKELYFTADQIVRIVSHDAGSRNLETVKNNYQALTELHFTAEQIVRMVSHPGGSRNLEAVKNGC